MAGTVDLQPVSGGDPGKNFRRAYVAAELEGDLDDLSDATVARRAGLEADQYRSIAAYKAMFLQEATRAVNDWKDQNPDERADLELVRLINSADKGERTPLQEKLRDLGKGLVQVSTESRVRDSRVEAFAAEYGISADEVVSLVEIYQNRIFGSGQRSVSPVRGKGSRTVLSPDESLGRIGEFLGQHASELLEVRDVRSFTQLTQQLGRLCQAYTALWTDAANPNAHQKRLLSLFAQKAVGEDLSELASELGVEAEAVTHVLGAMQVEGLLVPGEGIGYQVNPVVRLAFEFDSGEQVPLDRFQATVREMEEFLATRRIVTSAQG